MKLAYGKLGLKMDTFLKLILLLLTATAGHTIFESSDTEENGEVAPSVMSANVPCRCKHDVEKDHLVAYDGNKMLTYGDEVSISTEIKFHCQRPGYHRLFGTVTTKCQNDCSWDPPEIPSCLSPQETDIVIDVKAHPTLSVRVGPRGVLVTAPGTKLTLLCKTRTRNNRKLHWKAPMSLQAEGIETKENYQAEHMEIVLVVAEMQHHYNGNYACFAGKRISHSVSISVAEIECQIPAIPEYGSMELVDSKARVGSILLFSCDEDRKLIGSSTAKCLSTGEWTFPKPQCIKPCIIPDVPNGQLVKYEDVYRPWFRPWHGYQQVYASTTVDEGINLMLRCDRDYKPKEQSTGNELNITCLSGKLSPPPECVTVIICPLLPDPHNGRVIFVDRHYDAIATYECDRGYSLKGASHRVCGSDSQWSDESPVCEVVTSLPPGDLQNGRVIYTKDKHRSGDMIIFVCNPGGGRRRTSKCSENGEWSEWSPNCPGHKNMTDGTTPSPTSSSTAPTTKVSTSSPVRMNGSDVRITVRAEPAENLAVLADGVYVVVSGTRLDMECQISEGYVTQLEWNVPKSDTGALTEGGCVDRRPACGFPAYERRCTASRDWRTRICRKTCGACNSDYPFKVIYGIDQVQSLDSGQYTCIDRRMLSAQNFQHSVTIEVMDAQCPEIAETENLVVTYGGNRNVNTKAYFHCLEPYTISGLQNITCEPSGQWSSPAAICQHVQCPEIAETENLVVTYGGNRNVNTKAYFHCLEPYTMLGQQNITCEPSGQWSSPGVLCQLPKCSVTEMYAVLPEAIEHVAPYTGTIDEVYVLYGYSLNLVCKKGFVLKGNNTVVCGKDGKWTVDKTLRCIKGCRRIQTKKDSKLRIYPEKEFFEIGESITLSCLERKVLTNDVQRIMCFTDGWTPKNIPDCQ